jgi:hypothetical protein
MENNNLSLSKEFLLLMSYMRILANSSDYECWDDKTVGKFFMKNKELVLSTVETSPVVDYTALSTAEKELLGFRWMNGVALIPLWIFRLLPDDMLLVSFTGKIKPKKDCDDDVRGGCVAFGFAEEE